MPKCEACGKNMEVIDMGVDSFTGNLRLSYMCFDIKCIEEDVKDLEIYTL